MSGVTLRRRSDGATELRVDGVFVMDDAETSSERFQATSLLDAGVRDVLVGGLGLGYTTRELLGSRQITSVHVAEMHSEIVQWMRERVIPGADLLADPRLTLHLKDVREVVLEAKPASFDAIALDVDNGPDFLVHQDNTTLYQPRFLAECALRLRPHGHLAIWSQSDSPSLRSHLSRQFETVEAEPVPLRLQGRAENYWIVRGSTPISSR